MPPHPQRQAAFAVCYFSAYVGYLFLYQEHELLHWLSLVLIPLMALSIIGKYPSRRVLLESVGVGGGRATRGMTWVIVLGVAFQVLQLLNSRQRRELVGILREPLGFLLPLGALVLLIGTVATTEEVFFRGILQSRLSNWIRNEPVALVLATIAFALYHLPYAYLNPAWPSAGNFSMRFRPQPRTACRRASRWDSCIGAVVAICWRPFCCTHSST